LKRAVSNYSRHPVEFVCAGRTDSGVHAFGQVLHTELASGIDLLGLKRSVNRQLAPAIVIRSIEPAPDGFDARRSASARSYRYLILVATEPDPLISGFVWHQDDDLDIRSMRAGADSLLGEHNFSAFCRRPPDYPPDQPITRRILDARWNETPYFGGGGLGYTGYASAGHVRRGASASADIDVGDSVGRLLRFDVTATSFCHQMVRSLVGVLVEIGRRRMRPADIPMLLATGDRSRAKTLAPPHGLCLMRVDDPG
jgi:tRNA pseudouridine38-40 synthase